MSKKITLFETMKIVIGTLFGVKTQSKIRKHHAYLTKYSAKYTHYQAEYLAYLFQTLVV